MKVVPPDSLAFRIFFADCARVDFISESSSREDTGNFLLREEHNTTQQDLPGKIFISNDLND